MKYRTCTNCDDELELCEDNFHRDINSPEGFSRACKDCVKQKREDYTAIDKPKPRQRLFTPGFDLACDRDRLKRMTEKVGSIFKEAF